MYITKNWPISRMGYYLECTLILKHGPTLETWVKHMNPKLTRVPPCGFVELKQGDIPADKIIYRLQGNS